MRRLNRIVFAFLAFAAGFAVLFPLLNSISISFMRENEIFSNPPRLLPGTFYLGNYISVVKTFPIIKFYANTVFVSMSTTAAQILTASLAAYAFAFFQFKGKKILFYLVLATVMIPFEATIISNYITIANLKWLDTYQALILPYMASAYSIFLIRQFYLTVPKELKEAAMIDGCSNLKFLVKILMPLSRTIASALFIYLFINSWNHFLWPLLVTNSDAKRTVQIGLAMLKDHEGRSFGAMMAGVVMIALPTVVIFAVGQKYLIDGLFSGSVKG